MFKLKNLINFAIILILMAKINSLGHMFYEVAQLIYCSRLYLIHMYWLRSTGENSPTAKKAFEKLINTRIEKKFSRQGWANSKFAVEQIDADLNKVKEGVSHN